MIRSSILRSVELILGVLARDTVHGEADVLLIGAHSVIRPLAVDAVRRADIALVARVDQRLLLARPAAQALDEILNSLFKR